MRTRLLFVALGLAVFACGLYAYTRREALRQWMFDLTGEEQLPGQLRGLLDLASDLIRPRLKLEPEVPIAHNGANPFGINTFLQQEVEPAKRERQVQLIAEAGFHWMRQEFPWYDLEISGKGDFEDCRFPPCHSAWDKYDNIVSLAGQYGLEIIARLSSPPAWARADGTARGDFAPPDDFNDFADYAAAVAARYRGRVHYYQIWNEPNIYPEWGNLPADPEAYTRLLCLTYARLKSVDPEIVVLSGVLAPTSELGALDPSGLGATNLNDFIFLQRMYDAGAKGCFDVLTVQGYGLWSGPTDHRLRPVVVNYGRNQFIRDIMVANGDEHKAIWIAEMNWNAVPQDSGIPPNFGQVTEAQQARYAPLAYQRAQAEWPWVGVIAFWYFKDADDHERDQPKYYFRMADPDFTLKPVYDSMKAYTHQTPVMYPGWFQEDHWAVQWNEGWRTVTDPAATLGAWKVTSEPDTALRFVFSGTDLILVTARGPTAGRFTVRVDDAPPQTFDLRSTARELQVRLPIARRLRDGQHAVEIVSEGGENLIDGFIVRRVPDRTGLIIAALVITFAIVSYAARRMQ
jgi:polysaccharide biosynthesis protein PslG